MSPIMPEVVHKVYMVGDSVLVKAPHNRCITFGKVRITGIVSLESVLVDGMPHHLRHIRPSLSLQCSTSSEDDMSESEEEIFVIPGKNNRMGTRWRNTNQLHFGEALDGRDSLQPAISVIRRTGVGSRHKKDPEPCADKPVKTVYIRSLPVCSGPAWHVYIQASLQLV